ncbi:TolC family protein [bacterium]|nr:TolC family protein [bacterium]MBU1064725.1 TolC family protein [bacterium]MBU1634327.1 TolC family protein [bacterium]MBU1874571.1 TolC family protein [bacterium]
MIFRKNIILFCILLIIVTFTQAETLNLTLEKAKEIAFANNPSLKLAREGVRKSSQQVIEARGNLLPTVSAFSSLQHAWELATMVMNNPFSPAGGKLYFKMGSENTIASGINISQPVYTGGLIMNSYKISKLGYTITESQLKATEQKILSDVTSSYYGVLFMNSTLAVSEEALQSSEENLNQVTQYFNVGKSSRFDVLRAEVQVANMKPMVISTINNLKLAESHLRMVIGINDSIDFNYTEKLELVYSELTEKSLNVLIDLALTSRPEIVMMDNQKYIAQKQVSMSRAAFIPSVMFGTAYQYQGQRDDFKFTGDDFFKSFNSSVSISIPIFNGMKSSAKYQQAKIAVKETEHQTESLVNGIKLEVKAAYFSIQEAMEKVQTQQKTIEQAKEAQRLARLLYSEGSSTQLDVINADLAVQQAQMNYQQSLFEYNVALANLKKAINQL